MQCRHRNLSPKNRCKKGKTSVRMGIIPITTKVFIGGNTNGHIEISCCRSLTSRSPLGTNAEALPITNARRNFHRNISSDDSPPFSLTVTTGRFRNFPRSTAIGTIRSLLHHAKEGTRGFQDLPRPSTLRTLLHFSRGSPQPFTLLARTRHAQMHCLLFPRKHIMERYLYGNFIILAPLFSLPPSPAEHPVENRPQISDSTGETGDIEPLEWTLPIRPSPSRPIVIVHPLLLRIPQNLVCFIDLLKFLLGLLLCLP